MFRLVVSQSEGAFTAIHEHVKGLLYRFKICAVMYCAFTLLNFKHNFEQCGYMYIYLLDIHVYVMARALGT